MEKNNMSNVQKLTFSAMVIAIYVVIVFCTQGFSFGAYQIRIATALYALSYLFPFLVLPLGLANLLSNLIGGMGLLDLIGGFIVGILTAACGVVIRKQKWNKWLLALPIIFIPGLGVATWLSYILKMPYGLMALNLCIGQLIPGICGALLVKVLERVFR